jgi:hypothetical protein
MRWQVAMAGLLAAGCSLQPGLLANPGASARAEKMGAGIYRVALPPPGLAKCASADECTLVEAAEAAKGVGATHFSVLPGHGGPSQKGYAYIRVFTLDPADALPSGAVSVEEILLFFDKRPKEPVAG